MIRDDDVKLDVKPSRVLAVFFSLSPPASFNDPLQRSDAINLRFPSAIATLSFRTWQHRANRFERLLASFLNPRTVRRVNRRRPRRTKFERNRRSPGTVWFTEKPRRRNRSVGTIWFTVKPRRTNRSIGTLWSMATPQPRRNRRRKSRSNNVFVEFPIRRRRTRIPWSIENCSLFLRHRRPLHHRRPINPHRESFLLNLNGRTVKAR